MHGHANVKYTVVAWSGYMNQRILSVGKKEEKSRLHYSAHANSRFSTGRCIWDW